MAVEQKSGNSTDLQTVDPISKAARVTLYDTNGDVVDRSIPISISVNPVTVVDNDLVTSFDAGAYKFVSIQLTGTWVGTVSFQGSNDNGTFEDIVVQNTGSVITPYTISSSSNGGIKIPILFKYLRIRVTAYTSGSVEGTAFGLREDSNTGQISSTGIVDIGAGQTVGLDVGSNIIGSVRILSPITASTIYSKFISGTGVNETLIKGSTANMMTLHIISTAATPRYFKLYNKATIPIAGTDIPLITIGMASAGASNFQVPLFTGIDFSLGLGFAITLGVSDSDTTPFTVNGEVTGMIGYT
jgi:hypothetical protein